MTEVNVMLSIERRLDEMVSNVPFAQAAPELTTAYKLGVCESMLTQVLHQVYAALGEEAMITIMEKSCIRPVFSS
jgi:hypothetical protein